ncbi:hypothetical protein FWF48_03150 [Candidatus Saccharibacteria bacterium]|nr:hypothetical protein [Candidatus Saccharibacteria bacterium]
MGLIVNQNDEQTELQKRITAQLREKSEQTAGVDDIHTEYGFEDPTRDKKPMDKMTLAWIVIGVLAVGVIIAFFVLK